MFADNVNGSKREHIRLGIAEESQQFLAQHLRQLGREGLLVLAIENGKDHNRAGPHLSRRRVLVHPGPVSDRLLALAFVGAAQRGSEESTRGHAERCKGVHPEGREVGQRRRTEIGANQNRQLVEVEVD